MSIEYKPESDTTYPMFPMTTDTYGNVTNVITYEQFVCGLIKQLGSFQANVNHMVIGICGEAGEIADGIKKCTIYGKELDFNNIVEEMGDIEFYLAGLRQMLTIKRDAVLQKNFEKLKARYPGMSYSDADAIARADKLEPEGLVTIDMGPKISDDQVKAVDDTAGITQVMDQLAGQPTDLPPAQE